uniref:Uncharacterized protein n=1 Tax=Arion vulgaris TaxID=1028688 RepID=A0A0B7AB58_9EUPU
MITHIKQRQLSSSRLVNENKLSEACTGNRYNKIYGQKTTQIEATKQFDIFTNEGPNYN